MQKYYFLETENDGHQYFKTITKNSVSKTSNEPKQFIISKPSHPYVKFRTKTSKKLDLSWRKVQFLNVGLSQTFYGR